MKKRPKHESSSTPSFGFIKPKKIETAYDVVEYINYWYAKNNRGTDLRHYIAYHLHDSYATILYQHGMILEERELPPFKIGKFKAHISTNDDGLLEINYYD